MDFGYYFLRLWKQKAPEIHYSGASDIFRNLQSGSGISKRFILAYATHFEPPLHNFEYLQSLQLSGMPVFLSFLMTGEF